MELPKSNLILKLILIAESFPIPELIFDPIPKLIPISEPIPIQNLESILKPIPKPIAKPIPENDSGPTIRNQFHKKSELVGIDSD